MNPIIIMPAALKLNKFSQKYKSYANVLINANKKNNEQVNNK